MVEQGYETTVNQRYVDFYYAMKLRVVSHSKRMESRKIRDVNGQNRSDSFSPHSPKILFEND